MFVNIHTHRPTPDDITVRTAGVHPWNAATADISSVAASVGHIDAIGEIGLDHACRVDYDIQMQVFKTQLELARLHNLPIILHCVRAFEPLMNTIRQYDIPAVIFHGFTGSREQMLRAVDAGHYISFGERTFASRKAMEALRSTPKQRLFLETDDSPTPIAEIYRRVAEITDTDIATLQIITLDNYRKILIHNNG